MILRKRMLLALAPAIFLMSGCGGGNPSTTNSTTLDDVRYATRFPHTFTLDHPVEIETDIIGIQDLFIYDSLLILSTRDKEGLWSFLSLPDLPLHGQVPYHRTRPV
jgi:hypothetical protein